MTKPVPRGSRRCRPGFTLTELLIVIGLIILLATLAVPAFNLIIGGRGIDAAQNTISAYLARARADAIGLEEPRGVLFYPDADGQVSMIAVYFDKPSTDPLQLEQVPGYSVEQLPAGVGLQMLKTDASNVYLPGGVILFDRNGVLTFRDYRLTGTNLVKDVAPAASYTSNTGLSQLGFVLYDDAAFGPVKGTGTETTWVRDNGQPFLVNRLNGTLLGGK